MTRVEIAHALTNKHREDRSDDRNTMDRGVKILETQGRTGVMTTAVTYTYAPMFPCGIIVDTAVSKTTLRPVFLRVATTNTTGQVYAFI